MENTLTKVIGSSWIAKNAREEINHVTDDHSRPLPDRLRQYNLPPGLFPRNVKCHEFEESKGKLIVYLASACEVSFKDSSVVRYGVRVKATLTRGKMDAIEGMKTKVVLVYVKVASVSVEGYKSDKVWFSAAGIKRSRPKDASELPLLKNFNVFFKCSKFRNH